jgi:disulfide bond formation protein DsbB
MNKKHFIFLAWIISCIAMFVSLYYSEILDKEPCFLCWYQRISLFPLTIFLGVALYKEMLDIFAYTIAFPLFGMIFSGYQVILQEFPKIAHQSVCTFEEGGCATKVLMFGYISLPVLSFIGSFLIGAFLLLSSMKKFSE